MKKLTIAFILLISITSCDFFQRDFYNTYTVKNLSNHTVDIVYFIDSLTIENGVDTIPIGKDSSYVIYQNMGEGGHSYLEFLWADSMMVIFDKQKSLCYYGRSILEDTIFTEQRNPINRDSYDHTKERKHGTDFTYAITEEDYENAALIVKE